MKLPISVIILTRNEAQRLPKNLEALSNRVDEIIVVDMESTDESVSIANDYKVKVLTHSVVENFDIARVKGINSSSYEWILCLDADEIISDGLWGEIDKIIHENKYDIVKLPRADFCLSGFAVHESNFPSYHMRLFKKSCMDIEGYKGLIHTFFNPLQSANIGKIIGKFPDICIFHFSNPTYQFLMDKLNRYTTTEALNRYKKLENKGIFLLSFLINPVRSFSRQYIKNCGFLDGMRGFAMAMFWFIYEIVTHIKIWEMNLHKGRYPTNLEADQMVFEDQIKRR